MPDDKKTDIENVEETPNPPVQFAGEPKTKNKKSFKPFIYVLVVILLACVVGFGVYAWQQNEVNELQEKANSLEKQINDQGQSSPDTEEGESQSDKLLIDELRVSIDTSGVSQTLTYTFETQEGGVLVAKLGTTETNKDCNNGHLGMIRKAEGNIPADTEPFFITDNENNRVEYLLKQFDGFYIQYRPAQNSCELENGELFPNNDLSVEVAKAVSTLVTMD